MPLRQHRFRNVVVAFVLGVAVLAQPANADGGTVADRAASASTAPEFATLRGRWVRPDGGYVIDILAVDANGNLTASYANPSRLPFEVAKAARDGRYLKVFLELRAGGYAGSTYFLTYDPGSDSLKGAYYQAVARQRFEVVFQRAKP